MTSSPWGRVQSETVYGPGIVSVSTASHGGVKLDRERNALVPVKHRAGDGWYEEDCDWAIAVVACRDLIDDSANFDYRRYSTNHRTLVESAEQTLRGWNIEAALDMSVLPDTDEVMDGEYEIMVPTEDGRIRLSAHGRPYGHITVKGLYAAIDFPERVGSIHPVRNYTT